MTQKLETLARIQRALVERPAQIAKLKENGAKAVGWLNYTVPEEIIHALGLIPLRLGSGGSDRLTEYGSRWISSMNCAYLRNTVGLFAEGTDPWIQASDLVVVDVTCKQTFRLGEIVEHYFGTNVLLLGVPHNHDAPEGKAYFRHELQGFVEKLEAWSGRKLEAGALAFSVSLFQSIRETIQELYRAQATEDSPLLWRELYETVQAGYYLDRKRFLDLLRELLAEIKSGNRPAAAHQQGPRLLLSGSQVAPGDRKILDLVESLGGRIVVDDLWSGLAPHLSVDIAEPTVAAIADAYLGRITHAALPQLNAAADRRLANLQELATEFNVDGVLYHTLRYCDPYTFKAAETKAFLRGYDIPLLEIHTEYAGSDYEAIRTRLEAFVEVLAQRQVVEA